MNRTRLTIGTDPMCDISVEPDYKTVSPRHADITLSPDGTLTLTDHSLNGTEVNGKAYYDDSTTIMPGDRIVLGGDYNLQWGEVLLFFPSLNPTSPKDVKPSGQKARSRVISSYDAIQRSLNNRTNSRLRRITMITVWLIILVSVITLTGIVFFDDVLRAML